ncbi:MAG: hypothetical protein ACYTFY_05365 [Planctomycetota bacterium]|jgi:hypothetical protein
MKNPFSLDPEKDSQLIIDVFNVLRRSLNQYFKALTYAVKFHADKNLYYDLEISDIKDLGVDLARTEWQNIIYKFEYSIGTSGIKAVNLKDIPEFVSQNADNLDKLIIYRADIIPGIHNFLYKHIEDSISVARYMLRMAGFNPWRSAPWFFFNGITFKHGEDITIFLKNQPYEKDSMLMELQVSRRKAVLTLDKIRGRIYKLQSENPLAVS